MSRTATLATLRRQARELADQEESGADVYVDDTELNGMVNASIGLWHGLLAKAVPERYEEEQSIDAAADLTNGAADLPDDYYVTLGVDYKWNDESWIELDRASVRERTRYETDTSGHAVAYRLKGAKLVLLPAPSSGTYRHLYVSHAPELSLDADTIDGVNGWEQWVVYDVAIKMLAKEESTESAQLLIGERNRIQAEMESAASDREMGNPMRVHDARPKRWDGMFHSRDPDFWSHR